MEFLDFIKIVIMAIIAVPFLSWIDRKFKEPKYYLLVVWNDIEVETFGPFSTEKDRKEYASSVRRKHGNDHGIYAVTSKNDKIEIFNCPGGHTSINEK